jgi:methane/ammonia monooxygenase subunit B
MAGESGKYMQSKRFTRKTLAIRASALSFLIALGMAAALLPGTAAAHGERAEPPFLRMATVQWYDTHWSSNRVKVNEEMTISGRFHIVKYWSFAIAAPELAFLNVDVPGPVMIRMASTIDGVNAAASTPLELGRDYEYTIVMRGRIPGRYHVHPMLSVREAGPLLGPGDWVTVEGNAAAFIDPITTLTGEKLDLAHYGMSAVVSWHVLWALMAVGWLMYWIAKPLLMPRYEAVEHGEADSLITSTDRIVGIAFLGSTILIVLFGALVTRAWYPVTIPLQSTWLRIPPLPKQPDTITMTADRVIYYIPGRTVEFWVKVTNNGPKPVRIGEFTTAAVRFLNSSVRQPEVGFPVDLIAPAGLVVEPNEPIAPGETKALHILASSEVWETDRLALLVQDPTSRIGGLFMFFDQDNNRSLVEFDSAIVPTFVAANAPAATGS